MQNLNRKVTEPLEFPRTNRLFQKQEITSLPAGKMVPLMAMPLFREDSVRMGRFRFSFEMMETAEILMNAVNVSVKAYLVPNLAFPRFQGSLDVLNRSFMGQPPLEGEDVIPFITTHEIDDTDGSAAHEIYKYMGLHAKPEALVNDAYREAYNLIWNFRAENRSRDIAVRDLTDDTLAPAFWIHERFSHLVPDFDLAMMEGEVALNVSGTGITLSAETAPLVMDAGGYPMSPTRVRRNDTGADITGTPVYGDPGGGSGVGVNSSGYKAGVIDVTPHTFADLSGIVGEMQADGITISLSNIEMAKKTQAFARMRERYEGLNDEWVIDMLMQGFRIPDQALKQPMLLADKRTVFGMAKRYASDSGNLTESVVNGATMIDLSINLPPLNTGGVVMVVAEVTPDQLFERQKEPYFHMTAQPSADVQALPMGSHVYPNALRDGLDPQKVVEVPNDYVDIDHDTPNDLFAYAPLNHEWNMMGVSVGGRFYRPLVDEETDEDRQRIWAVETQNPVLSEDFYVCTTMHQKPFVVTDQDPFEVVIVGQAIINGLTQFGGVLIEASDNYQKVLDQVPTERITKEEEE